MIATFAVAASSRMASKPNSGTRVSREQGELSKKADAVAFSRRVPLIVAAAFFMEMLDGTIVATALPAIARSLERSTLDLSITITVYLVAMAAFIPTAGWASARFGARRLFAFAIGVFTFASVLCGLSPSLEVLVAARLLQGIAAAFMSPVGRLIVLSNAPKERIIDAIALIVWPALIAPVVGPPLGGFITTYASWRWIFLINLPLGIAGVFLVLRFVAVGVKPVRASLDKRGFVLTAVALASLIYGLTLFGDRRAGLVEACIYTAIGVVAGAAAVQHALRHPAPMLDLSAVRVPTFALCIVSAGLLARCAISMTPFLLPLMFQLGFGASAFEAGLMLLIYMAGNLAMKSVTTPILRRFSFRNVLLINGALCAASLAACGFLSTDVPPLAIYAVLFAAGLTRSMNFTSTNTLSFADLPDAMRPGATTLAAMAQQVGNVLGVAIAAGVLGISEALRSSTTLSLVDFQRACLASAVLMALSVVWMRRLPANAGAELSRRP